MNGLRQRWQASVQNRYKNNSYQQPSAQGWMHISLLKCSHRPFAGDFKVLTLKYPMPASVCRLGAGKASAMTMRRPYHFHMQT
jgi:hypothetical protein